MNNKNDYDLMMAAGTKQWRDGSAMTVTFCVTEDCNLACKYCYMVGKNNKRIMQYETAKKIVDFVLSNDFICHEDGVAWDFIGGEPLLEMDLIIKISDYIVAKMYKMNHKWKNTYRFTFSSNGILYGSPEVRDYINTHNGHAWFGISVDGTKEKHDNARVKKDGSGSYNDVIKNVPLWLEEYPNAITKATFSHDDLPYLKESIIHLWNLGIKDVMANVVYEDVWQENDDTIFEEQLKSLADYVNENELWDSCTVSFLNSRIGLPVDKETLYKNRCGAGFKSVAFDCEGNIYPCIRFLEMCNPDKNKIIIGNIKDGLNMDYLRAFASLQWICQSPDKCNNCEVGLDCGWCEGYNFECSKTNSIFERTTFICKMHKANARAVDYMWKNYSKKTRKTSPRTVNKVNLNGVNVLKYLYIITGNDVSPHCSYINNKKDGKVMSPDLLNKGLRLCFDNNLVPIFIGKCDHSLNHEDNLYYEILDKVPKDDISSLYVIEMKNILDSNDIEELNKKENNVILLILKKDIYRLSDVICEILNTKERVNLFIQDMEEWDIYDVEAYQKQLEKISSFILSIFKERQIQLNVLTDLIYLKEQRDCGAGLTSLALAPNGKLYICPAFYFENELDNIGDILNFDDKSFGRLCKRENSPGCSKCDINSCTRCLYKNKMATRELNVSSKIQCLINNIQGKVSNELRDRLVEKGYIDGKHINVVKIRDYIDPIILERN